MSILYFLVSFHQFHHTLHLEYRCRPRRSLGLAIGHHALATSIVHCPSGIADEHTHHHSSKPVCICNRAHCPPRSIIITIEHSSEIVHRLSSISRCPSSIFHQASSNIHDPKSVLRYMLTRNRPQHQYQHHGFEHEPTSSQSCQYQWVLGWLSSLISFPCYDLLFSAKGGYHRP
jgi:hypothetical protein